MRKSELTRIIINEIISREIKIPIPLTVSNRHVHIDDNARKVLFGDKPLTVKAFLAQPGEFAAEETVKVIGPKGHFDAVRIVGPERSACQLEISVGDCYQLGVKPPTRASGQLEGDHGIYLAGPKGVVRLEREVIVAQRHIHMPPADAQKYGVKNMQMVRIRFDEGFRRGILGDILIRVSESFALECHIDIEEANALGLKNNDTVYMEIGGV